MTTATAARPRSTTVLSVMQPGTRYRATDLALLSGMTKDRVERRLTNLFVQGRVMRTTRDSQVSNPFFLYERSA